MNGDYGEPATPDQIEQALEELSDADWMRLRKLATRHLWGTRLASPDDLIGETVDRLLRGKRHWPIGLPFIPWMDGAMKSVADGFRNLDRAKLEVLAAELTGDDEEFAGREPMDMLAVDCETPLDTMLTVEAQKEADAARAKLEDHFRGDEEVGWILMGIDEGLRGEEIQEIGEMGKTQYETARKRLRRGIERLFSERRKS